MRAQEIADAKNRLKEAQMYERRSGKGNFIKKETRGMIDLIKTMEEDMIEGPGRKLNPKYHLDRKKHLGKIDPYSKAGYELMTPDERITMQRLWCIATRAVPLPPSKL